MMLAEEDGQADMLPVVTLQSPAPSQFCKSMSGVMKSKGCLTVTHWEKDNDLPMRRQIWRDSRYEGDDVKA